MVGRTPEYLGKKIEAYSKMAMLVTLGASPCLLAFSAISTVKGLAVQHLESWSSRAQRDYLRIHLTGRQQRFGICGLTTNTLWYNTAAPHDAVGVLHDHPMLAIAGNLRARICPPSLGTLPSDYAVIPVLLIGVILMWVR